METWTIDRVLRWATQDLKERGFDSPRLDAELMLCLVLGCDRIKLVVDAKRPLEQVELTAYRELHKRRHKGEPVAYLRGEREFFSRDFFVDERVLVPRPETELLVEVGMRRTAHISLSTRAVDLCTGSGCVAVTLKKERPTACVMASDVSETALEVARRNCERHAAVVGLVRSDLYEALGELRGRVDLITANPPYVPEADAESLPADVRDFEPREALVAGEEGLAVIRRLIEGAPAMLAPAGVLATEVEAGRAADVAALFEAAGLVGVEIDRDYGGHERVVSGRGA